MNLDFYTETGRLESFYDAVIAIIVTILVLELPQPETATLSAIWNLKVHYFAYFISFLVCVNMWQYHHRIYRHVDKINNRIIWLNILLLLILSLIPYLTLFVSENFNSFLAQAVYGLDYILVDVVLSLSSYALIKANPDSNYLKDALSIKNTLVIPLVLFLAAFIIGFFGFPQAISVICLFTIVMSISRDILS